MAVTPEHIDKIAHLSRLSFADHEKDQFFQEIEKILALVDTINHAATANIEPMAHPHDGVTRLRPDVVTEHVNREAFQDIAPQTEAGLYLVPTVIE